MKTKPLGNSGLMIAGPLALGGNVFGWTADESVSFRILDAFVAAGLNFIDTADVYSRWAPGHTGGESESVIGRWLKRSGKRAAVTIATKVGLDMGPAGKGLSRAHILAAVDASLRRLQTDHIDLYQSHTDDPDTPFEETLATYAELIKQGKVRAIGASNYTAERLAEALRVSRASGLPSYRSLQPLYNLYDRSQFEEKLDPLCRQASLGVITYFSLASGFLTGKYRSEADLSKSLRGGNVKKYLNERGARILAALDEVAERLKSSPAQVSLAWLMAHRGVSAPIASATSVEQLQTLIGATRLSLDSAAVALLNQASG
jgi:aryl-alcohol dehydrogenase-like predicted oxidoreductase